ncbi:hypothetical protein ABEB36_003327 [Hypothenemus hampei]|uniref:Hexosyltransferase n=1 Tax=Hypothenemus hampei TaxID=57062 RepID=A0ABD1F8U6_HYPHA
MYFKYLTNSAKEDGVVGWDINVSRDLHDYLNEKHVQIPPIKPKNICGSPVFLAIICMSRPSAFNIRRVIRNTWARPRTMNHFNVSFYFLLGLTRDLEIQKRIIQESQQFNDIIQENFYDSYNNLTLKSAMMLKVFTQHCRSAKYLLKADDDIYLNLPLLIESLHIRNKTNNLLVGSMICGGAPKRDPNCKWYAGPNYIYPYSTYPNYVSGSTYCMSGDVARKLFNVALTIPLFHVEDVFITGICARKIRLQLTHDFRYSFHYLQDNTCLFKRLIAVHHLDSEQIEAIYHAEQDEDLDKQCLIKNRFFLVYEWLLTTIFIANNNGENIACGNGKEQDLALKWEFRRNRIITPYIVKPIC